MRSLQTYVGIEDWQPVLSVRVQAGQELATFLNAIVGIVSEDAVEVEVVKITHDTFELDLRLRVQIDYFLQVGPV